MPASSAFSVVAEGSSLHRKAYSCLRLESRATVTVTTVIGAAAIYVRVTVSESVTVSRLLRLVGVTQAGRLRLPADSLTSRHGPGPARVRVGELIKFYYVY